MNETEVLRSITKELNDVERFCDDQYSALMNRMKESMYKFKELELSDKQIAELLGLVYKGYDAEIEDMLSTCNLTSYLLQQLDKSYEIIRHNTESLISMYNTIQLRNNMCHNGVHDEKGD